MVAGRECRLISRCIPAEEVGRRSRPGYLSGLDCPARNWTRPIRTECTHIIHNRLLYATGRVSCKVIATNHKPDRQYGAYGPAGSNCVLRAFRLGNACGLYSVFETVCPDNPFSARLCLRSFEYGSKIFRVFCLTLICMVTW